MPSTNGHGPKRAILYARVSTDEQARSGYSLAQQMEALRAHAAREGYEGLEEVAAAGYSRAQRMGPRRAHAAREGYEVLEEVSDAGYSGASLERPGMDRVRDLVASEAGGGPGGVAPGRDRLPR